MVKCLRIIIIIGLMGIVFAGCKNSNNENFLQLTTSIHQAYKNNYNLYSLVLTHKEKISDSSYLTNDILALHQFIDSVNIALIYKSGGFDMKSGELVGGERKDLGKEIFFRYDFFQKVKSKLVAIKSNSIATNNPAVVECIKDLESDLYTILAGFWNENNIKNFTVAKLSLDLKIIQNSILITEIKYFERVNNFN